MYYKIQRVFCIIAIILLYFEKKITDEFFEIYKRSSKTKLMSQTKFAKVLNVSYSIVSRRGLCMILILVTSGINYGLRVIWGII